ncbi:MAG: hypothetical protein CMF62_03125 [Magnetococcales bacterium]|nr:hypothetical protein [Magnetococcales bacterium]|tara:strand:- start:32797 stop:33795 length:999 start_codon:yes stop_codon:yes gene_type:complete
MNKKQKVVNERSYIWEFKFSASNVVPHSIEFYKKLEKYLKYLTYNDILFYNSIRLNLKKIEDECYKRKMIPTKDMLYLCLELGDLERYKLIKSYGINLTDEEIYDFLINKKNITIQKYNYDTNSNNNFNICKKIIDGEKVENLLNFFADTFNKFSSADSIFNILTLSVLKYKYPNEMIIYKGGQYYKKNQIKIVSEILKKSKLKFNKKLLLLLIPHKIHFDIIKYNIELDDEIIKCCQKNNYYPFDVKFTDEFVLKSLSRPNKTLLTKISKDFKFKRDHLREAIKHSNKTGIEFILKNYKPDISDFEFFLNNKYELKRKELELLKIIYKATK